MSTLNHKLLLATATWHWPGWRECVKSWLDNASNFLFSGNVYGKDILEAYQEIYESAFVGKFNIIGYLHDDLEAGEQGWDERVMAEFEDPAVGLVGFAGAPGHGHPMMYQPGVLYEAAQLGRVGFRSNMRDAEIHGARFTGACDVAVLDGLALFVRRELLERAGGWPRDTPVGYFCYDYWISCIARELGYKIRLVGVACHHHGGKSTGLNPNLKADYEEAHRYIYERFRGVLPAMVSE